MKQNNRVLGRLGARELTPEETDHVVAALGTDTVCTCGPNGKDGDTFLGEC
jgi:hypothetical protein